MAGDRPLVVVLTATSRVGDATVKSLLRDHCIAVRIRAVVRSSEKAEQLREKFPDLDEIRVCDDSVFVGASAAFIVAPQDSERDVIVNKLLAEAASQGCQRVVFLGGVFQEEQKFVNHRQWMSCRRAADSLGLRWTQLECTEFFENFYSNQRTIVLEGRIYGAGSEGCSPAVALEDVGRAAASVLASSNAVHDRKAYRIVGPEVLGVQQLLRACGRQLRRPIEFVDMGVKLARKVGISGVPKSLNKH